MLSVSSLQVVQQPKPLHRGHIWLSPYPMAQHSGGTDLCGHSHQVFQGLSHRGAQWPTANCRLCPSDNPDMSDPRHGQPGGAQDQERRWQRLKVLNFCSTAKKCRPGLPTMSQLGDNSLFTHTLPLCLHLNWDFKNRIFLYPAPRNSEVSAWHWFKVNVMISGSTIINTTPSPKCQQRVAVTKSV